MKQTLLGFVTTLGSLIWGAITLDRIALIISIVAGIATTARALHEIFWKKK
jgi:hypothetical protein